MKADWYITRPRVSWGQTARALKVTLRDEEWRVVDGLARESEFARGRMISQIVSDWLKRQNLAPAEEPLKVRIERQLRPDPEEARS